MDEVIDSTIFEDDIQIEAEHEKTVEIKVEEDVKEEEEDDSVVPSAAAWLNEEGEDTPDTKAEAVPVSLDEAGSEGRLQFFWLDAYEDMKHQPGKFTTPDLFTFNYANALTVFFPVQALFSFLARCRVKMIQRAMQVVVFA